MSDDDSDASTYLPDVFLNDPSNHSSDSESKPDSSDDLDDCLDNDSDDDLILDEEEVGELPAEYYLQEAECLNVLQLRQKRYSPMSQSKLDET